MEPRVLTYDARGAGDPLVLVPGGLTGWVSWIPHQERLATRYRVIRVQPIPNEMGSAGIPGDPSYTRAVELESVRLTLDHLGLDTAHFAGWSNGGRSLIEFTLAHPQRVRSLALVEPGAYWILAHLGEVDSRLEQASRQMTSLAGRTVTEDDLAAILATAGFVEDPARARQDPYWERALPHRMALSWISEEVMSSDHVPDDLASITCPVLVTKGTTTAPWERRVVDLIGELVPDARVVELEGSHAHHIESIDEFLEELETHLERAGSLSA